MGNLLQGCFLYRWALAIFAWFSRVADGSRVRRGISVCWESSKLAAFLHRCLSSGTVQIDESLQGACLPAVTSACPEKAQAG